MIDVDQQLALEALVLRAMGRDMAAFDSLVRHYHKRLLYYVARLTRDSDRAEDVMQNVWIDVYQQLPTLRSTRAFSTWLYRIARNHTCRELRRYRREVPAESLEELPEDIPGADDQALSADEVAALHRCMDALSPEHRESLILRYMEELSYEEIADIAGCSVGTVRSRIHYAKKALAQNLEALNHGQL
jgi:RNA polymerase sigma-70 factor (ECF subfamily)